MTISEIRAAIADQLGRFARLLDTRQWDAIDTVFAPDVSFDYSSGREEAGIDALRATFRRYLDQCGPSQHLLGSIIVEFANDGAPVSRSYVQARHCGKGALADQWFDTNGEYVDTWRRDDGVWRIVRRDADFSIFVGNPAVIGFDAATH